MHKKQLILTLAVAVFCMLQSGCALLQIPGKILDLTGNIIKGAFGLLQRMPMPPPGVF